MARCFWAERVGLIRAIHGPDFHYTKAPKGVLIRSRRISRARWVRTYTLFQ